MRVVIALLSASYSGRGNTELPPYKRALIEKEDGSISIHSERGFKPMNYMANVTEKFEDYNDDEMIWTFKTKTDKLVVTFHEIYGDMDINLGDTDPGHSSRTGTEEQLQGWIAEHIEIIDPKAVFISREFATGSGPVDILAEIPHGPLLAIEVKRVADMNSIGQVLRYCDGLKEKKPDREIVPVLAALAFKNSTTDLAHKNAVHCVTLPEDWLTEDETKPDDNPWVGTLFG